MQQLLISPESANERLDKVLATLLPQYSRAYLQEALAQGKILLNEKIAPGKTRLKGHEIIHYDLSEKTPTDTQWQPENIPLAIVYEDEALLVVNKPVGLVVHPGAGNWQGTLVNGLLYAYPELQHLPRAGIVHRLDKDTSGLLLVAKTREAHHALVKQLQKRKIHREYLALVYGEVTAGGTIEAGIGRHPRDRLKKTIDPSGKQAITHYRLEKRLKNFTLLRVKLETGRTHQIRVHLASVHYPIVGDPLYGNGLRFPEGADEKIKTALKNFTHQALHATALKFTHPVTGQPIELSAPMPPDLEALLAVLT